MQPYIDKRRRCIVGTQLLNMLLYYPVFLEGKSWSPLRGERNKVRRVLSTEVTGCVFHWVLLLCS